MTRALLTLALAVVAIAACASNAEAKLLKAGCTLGGAYANVTSTGKGLVSIKELNATHAQVTLGVTKTKGVTMAHFHILPSKNPVVWLLFRTTQTGGKLLTGIDLTNAKATFTITTSDLVADLAGAPTLAWLYGNITAGNIYTNVHTVKYPAGEIACLVAKRGAL